MNTTLAIAFKEWAVIGRALADGRQSLILRKGGIAESGGSFRPEYERFWLYPTYFHEHRTGVTPEFAPLFEAADADRPPAEIVRLSHFAEVRAVHHVADLESALRLAPFHGWTEEIVRQRFHYRTPGLYVLIVRTMAVPRSCDIPERPEYAGCKTWVTIDPAPSTAGAVPVLGDVAEQDAATRIEAALRG